MFTTSIARAHMVMFEWASLRETIDLLTPRIRETRRPAVLERPASRASNGKDVSSSHTSEVLHAQSYAGTG
jgi:hypothetical protein